MIHQATTKPVQLWDNSMTNTKNGWTEETRGHARPVGQAAVWAPDDSRVPDVTDSPPPGRLEKLPPRNSNKNTDGIHCNICVSLV